MSEYFGIKILFEEREVFIHISRSLRTTKQFGKGPYYKLIFKEAVKPETNNYRGWKISREETYRFIHPLKVGIEICFPYGTKAEEEKGKGKLVELVLESAIQIE